MDENQNKYYELIEKRRQLDNNIKQDFSKIQQHLIDSTSELKDNVLVGSPIRPEELKGYHAKKRAVSKYQDRIANNQKELDGVEKKIKNLNLPQSFLSTFSTDYNFMLTPVKLQVKFVVNKHIYKLKDKSSLFKVNSTSSTINNQLLSKIKEFGNEPYSGIVPVSRYVDNRSKKYPIKADKHELWIRIYPDAIHNVTHNEILSANEVNLAKGYHKEIYAIDSSDEIEKEQARLKAWKKVIQNIGITRALYIVTKCKPINESGFPEFEDTSATNERKRSWNKAPCAMGLPNRFIVRVFENNNGFHDYTCNPLPLDENKEPCLDIGLNPSAGSDSPPFEITDDGLEVDERLRWLTEFDAAVKVGMGIRIPLTPSQYKNGFDKIIVLGVRSEKDSLKNKQLIEKLLKNHCYKPEGLSFLPIGTPTNNTDDKRSASNIEQMSVEESFELLMGKSSSKSNIVDFLQYGTDAQRLTISLGLDNLCLRHAAFGNNTEISNAVALNRALSFGTLGYGIAKMFKNDFKGIAELNGALQIFNHFVLGRGSLPTIRIGNQPYGFLPVSRFSQLKLPQKDSALENNLVSEFTHELEGLWSSWKSQIYQLKKVSEDNANDNAFLSFLSTCATSKSLNYREWLNGNSASTANPQLDWFKSFNEGIERYKNARDPNYINLDAAATDQSFKRIENITEWTADTSKQNSRFKLKNYIHFFADQLNYKNFSSNLWIDMDEVKKLVNMDIGKEATESYNLPIGFQDGALHAPLLILYLRFTILRAYRFNSFEPDIIAQNMALNDLLGFDKEKSKDEQITENLSQYESAEIARVLKKTLWPSNIRVSEPIDIYATKVDEVNNMLIENFSLADNRVNNATNKRKLNDLSQNNTRVDWDTLLTDYYILNDIDAGLEHLKNVSNENLEQLFLEHLDILSYRMDSWFTGLTYYNLLKKNKDFKHDIGNSFSKRLASGRRGPLLSENKGLYYGAYGYVEEVGRNRHRDRKGNFSTTSSNEEVILKEISTEELGKIDQTYQKLTPIVPKKNQLKTGDLWIYLGSSNSDDDLGFYNRAAYRDKSLRLNPLINSKNQGFVPSPSLDHATTAAILRSGYQHQAQEKSGYFEADEIPFATNLSSRRVRTSLFYLEGLENGQELSHLIGYRFERAMKEAKIGLERYIPYFRRAFPNDIEKIDQDNVVKSDEKPNVDHVTNGIALIDEFKRSFGEDEFFLNVFEDKLATNYNDISFWRGIEFKKITFNDPAHKVRMKRIINEVRDELDGINDLLISEGIFQISRGNIDRAAAALKVMSGKGSFVMPQIQEMPRQGYPITHTVGILMDETKLTNTWGSDETPLSFACPQINCWLSRMLPSPYKIIVKVKWKKELESEEWFEKTIRLSNLELQPIDLIYMISDGGKGNTAGELLFRVENYLLELSEFKDLPKVGHHLQLVSEFMELNNNEYLLNELHPLIDSLYNILTKGRMLEPKDFTVLLKNKKDKDLKIFHDVDELNGLIEPNIKSLYKLYQQVEKYLRKVADLAGEPVKTQDLNALKNLLLQIARFRLADAIPLSDADLQNTTYLSQHLEGILKKLKKRKDAISHYSKELNLKEILEVVEGMFGRGVLILPALKNPDVKTFRESPNTTNYLDKENPFEVEEWIQSLAPVRPKMGLFQSWDQLTSSVLLNTPNKRIYQFPLRENPNDDYWFGMRFNKTDFSDNGNRNDVFSYLFYSLKDTPTIGNETYAIVIDQWLEQIPQSKRNMGIAMHYDQPSNEPPQNVLISVSSSETEYWDWEDLMGSISETFDLAKMRLLGSRNIPNEYRKYLPLLFAPEYPKSNEKNRPEIVSLIPRNSIPPEEVNKEVS